MGSGLVLPWLWGEGRPGGVQRHPCAGSPDYRGIPLQSHTPLTWSKKPLTHICNSSAVFCFGLSARCVALCSQWSQLSFVFIPGGPLNVKVMPLNPPPPHPLPAQEPHDKTRDVVLSQDIPLLMTKATGKPRGETWRGWAEGRRRQERSQEVNGLIQRVGGRGQRATRVCFVCRVLQGHVQQVRKKQDCWQGNVVALIWLSLSPPLLLSPVPLCRSQIPLVCRPNSLPTLHSSIGASGTSQFSLCRLSRWPSLRSALECCFYIAASGGMWSLFWTARQTDGGFHAAFMRLRTTFL